MSKVEVTLSKILADQLGIKLGDEVHMEVASGRDTAHTGDKEAEQYDKRLPVSPTAAFRSRHSLAETAP